VCWYEAASGARWRASQYTAMRQEEEKKVEGKSEADSYSSIYP